MKDVVVVGGGPVGLAASIYAAQAGLSVTVLEAKSGVIDKACGEGLMPSGHAALQALGIALPTAHPIRGIRYIDAKASADATFSSGCGLGVRRTRLHQALIRQADALGVERRTERVAHCQTHTDHIEAAGVRGRYLIGADGLRSVVRQQLGVEQRSTSPKRYGIRRHFSTTPWSDHVEVYWTHGAEAYVTPIEGDTLGVAILYGDTARKSLASSTAPPHPFDRLLAQFPRLADRLGKPASPPRGAGPFVVRCSKHVVGRTLLIGDASGYLDPLTGEGLSLGFAQAHAAVQAIRGDTPAAYEAEWWRITRSYRWLTSALLTVARSPRSRSLIVPTAARFPQLMRWTVNTLGA